MADMVVKHIQQLLKINSRKHAADLRRLGQQVEDEPLSPHVLLLEQSPQLRGIETILEDQDSSAEEFIFYFDRLVTLLVERYVNHHSHGIGMLKRCIVLWMRLLASEHFRYRRHTALCTTASSHQERYISLLYHVIFSSLMC